MLENERVLFHMVIQKYKILKIRLKISFMAFQQNKSVKEMFLSAIIKAYMNHVQQGHIKDTYDQF